MLRWDIVLRLAKFSTAPALHSVALLITFKY